VRVAGVGDAAPGAGGAFGSLNLLGFNNNGEQLFSSTIAGGSGGNALFIGDISGVRKVVAQGDSNPSGGVFPAIVSAMLNNRGEVAFQAGTAIYVSVPGSGISRVTAPGDAVPAPVGGTIGASAPFILQSFGDGSDVVFVANIVGSGVSTGGLFRRRSTNPLEIVAYRNQAVPGAPGQTFGSALPFGSSIRGSSVNDTGVVSFHAFLQGGPALNGVFQQSGANSPVVIALDGQATTLSGGGSYRLTELGVTLPPGTVLAQLGNFQSETVSLNNGAVFFRSNVAGGTADYVEALNTGGVVSNLMNTGDSLPAGSRVVLRTFRVGASGDRVGFLAQRTGGRTSIVEHSIADQSSHVLFSDGDVAPDTGGGTLRLFSSRNTVYQNTSGTMVFTARIIGESPPRNIRSIPSNIALFVKTPDGALTKIVADGDIDPGSGQTFSAPSINNLPPSPINDAGQVVFVTSLGLTRTIFVWSAETGLTKIAAAGDVTSSGETITSVPFLGNFPINSSGQVAFQATTAPGGLPGIFIGSGAAPAKVVAAGDPGPAGSIFLNFGTHDFNDNGEVAFTAILTGGPGGGIFVGSASGPPVSLALNGDAAPAGGNFSITAARPDVVINNRHDVVFRSNLTGGTADSGYFVRRGAGGTLQTVVLQGAAAPGTTGVFDTILPSLANFVSETFQIGPDGDIAFQSVFLDGGQRILGAWHVRTDNVIEEMVVRGAVAPESGGGTIVSFTPSFAWNSGGRYALWGRVSGGTYTDGIFLFDPITEVIIDIKPGRFPNSINLRKSGEVPVAVISSPTFDASTIDPSTVRFAGAPALLIGGHPRDVNHDGRPDRVFRFKTAALQLTTEDTQACLSGETVTGVKFRGCDSVRVIQRRRR
jgi:hypothetical protein